jgi:hypothetical protein
MKRILLAALAVVIPAAVASAQPNPAEVYVQSISYGGSGCPGGSVGNSFANDRKSFTLIFDSFVASQGPGVPVTENRKNCQVNLNLHVPGGWQFSIGTVDYRGYVQLPAGVTARQKATYSFSGSPAQISSGASFTGPVSKDYLQNDSIPFSTIVWSACGAVAPVNINSEVRTSGGAAPAQITTDSIDGKVQQIFGLQWRPC